MRFHHALLIAVVSACGAASLSAADTRPNVILILADDLGYETLGANGGTSYKTPVLDRLAGGGVRFDHCYVQPLCTPTRVQLMTGQYNIRNYTVFGQMSPELPTFGNFFHDAGYATCIAGKWQLGRDVALPKRFGFDEACLWPHLRRPDRYKNPGLEINGKPVDYTDGEYGPDIVNDYALDFIERHKSQPFFLYYPMMLTHSPYDPTPDSPDYAVQKKDKSRDNLPHGVNPWFGDMVAYMDKLIGKLVARLDQVGLRENTLILFVGDNGTGQGTCSMMGNTLVVGGKSRMVETGMRVPLLASWPGHIAAGVVCHDLVDSTDCLPTICQASGVNVPSSWPIDGHSFLPQLRGERGQPRNWYYCWYAPHGQLLGEFAADARYKLYRNGKFYDVAQDPEEKHPQQVGSLIGAAAATAKTLQAGLDKYKDARPAEVASRTAKMNKRAKAGGDP